MASSLQELKKSHVPRTYASFSSSQARYAELCVFSDASVKAIAAVGYLKLTDRDGLSEKIGTPASPPGEFMKGCLFEKQWKSSGILGQEEESLGAYASDVRLYAQRGYPGFPAAAREDLALYAFLQGLMLERLRQHVCLTSPQYLGGALDEAQWVEFEFSTRPSQQLSTASQTARKVRKERRRFSRPGLERPTAAAFGVASLVTWPAIALGQSPADHGAPVQPAHQPQAAAQEVGTSPAEPGGGPDGGGPPKKSARPLRWHMAYVIN
ncbi:unnamed protein product [Lota lota]